jgi:carboxymethylenebutenolidase
MKSLQHPTEPPPAGPSWEAGERVTFGGLSDKGTGYMAYSERVGPSVLLLHDGYGLLPSVEELADGLVADGFTALAPDLYDGAVARTAQEAHTLFVALDEDVVDKRLRAAAEHLTNNWHPRLGVIGFSMGASLATRLARTIDLDATVVYYGGGAGLDEEWDSGPLLGHFAEDDASESAATARRVMGSLDDGEVLVYRGCAHGFANSALNGAYDPAAAELAWSRTLEELHYQLS